MNHDSCASLSDALGSVGLIGQQSNPDQLIVSTQQGPVWPNRGNSFWLSRKNGAWYLSTWLPACYRIPEEQDIVELCSACMESGSSAMNRVPEDIAVRFGLQLITDGEFERLFPENQK